MKTIEIQQRDFAKNKRLIHYLYKKYLYKSPDFHFLYEPYLIIRLSDRVIIGRINRYLYEKGYIFYVYNYPFPKYKLYGESKQAVTVRYSKEFLTILHEFSMLAIKRNKRDDYRLIERITHTGMNTWGYEWSEESLMYTKLLYTRNKTILQYDRLSGIAFNMMLLANWLIMIVYKLLKLL